MTDPGRLPATSAIWLRVYRAVALLTQPKYTIGAATFVRRPSGEVLLVRQRLRTPSRWGLPGGFKKPHEAAAAAAARELREEAGLDLRITSADLIAEYEHPWTQHLEMLFCVTYDPGAAPTELRHPSLEIAEIRWFALDALPPLTREAGLALQHLPTPGVPRSADDPLPSS
jgi:ADP-ribose pyrophosphatase YjhB (NUDIX family)